MSGEIKNVQRTLPRAIAIAVSTVIAIYVLVNLAYLYIVPVGEMARKYHEAQAGGGSYIVAIDVVDSFLGRVINEIATSSRLMGAQVVVTGLRPAVAITMVEMGLTFKNVEMAKNLDKGLLLLRKLMHGNEQMKGH
jgi:rsbT antagonist protein RsbS